MCEAPGESFSYVVPSSADCKLRPARAVLLAIATEHAVAIAHAAMTLDLASSCLQEQNNTQHVGYTRCELICLKRPCVLYAWAQWPRVAYCPTFRSTLTRLALFNSFLRTTTIPILRSASCNHLPHPTLYTTLKSLEDVPSPCNQERHSRSGW